MANQKRCECGAIYFQGPFYRGPIVSGKMDRKNVIYQCMGCNRQHDKNDPDAKWKDIPVRELPSEPTSGDDD